MFVMPYHIEQQIEMVPKLSSMRDMDSLILIYTRKKQMIRQTRYYYAKKYLEDDCLVVYILTALVEILQNWNSN